MNFDPLISIIIPVYNGSNYMREAIDSAINQTYKNIEIIVINDGSDDGGKTDEIARSYGDKIRYFRKENGGVSSALNMGIRHMRGDYFSWLSHDDVYLPDKIEESVRGLQQYGDEMLIAICGVDYIDSNSEYISSKRKHFPQSSSMLLTSVEALTSILIKSDLNGCSLLIPRGAFEKAGFFNEELRFCQDVLMWYNMLLQGYGLLNISGVGVKSRIHAQQVTQTRRDLFSHDCAVICDIVLDDFEKLSCGSTDFVYLLAIRNAKYGNSDAVRKCAGYIKQRTHIDLIKLTAIKFISLYGEVRPLIRKLYYKLRYSINTK